MTLPEPADQNEPGSIEQQLDMVENGPGPRGDSIIRTKGKTFDELNNTWESFLKENPPEETASGARDQLGLLLKQRAEAEKRLKQVEFFKHRKG